MAKTTPFLRFSPEQEMSHPLLELRYCEDERPPQVSLHAHLFYEFFIFVGGPVDRYLVAQKSYDLMPGDILIIPPMALHHPIFSRSRSADQTYRRYYFWVTREYLRSIEQLPEANMMLECCKKHHEYLIHPPELLRRRFLKQLETAWNETYSAQICADLYLQAHCLRFFAALNNYLHSTGGQLSSQSHKHNDIMEEIMAYIHDNFDKKLTLQSTALLFHVSISTIEMIFNQTLGKSFYQYVTEYRIATAQALILDGLPLQEVSRRCGYADYSNFYKAFAKHVGCSPSAFGQLSRSIL